MRNRMICTDCGLSPDGVSYSDADCARHFVYAESAVCCAPQLYEGLMQGTLLVQPYKLSRLLPSPGYNGQMIHIGGACCTLHPYDLYGCKAVAGQSDNMVDAFAERFLAKW